MKKILEKKDWEMAKKSALNMLRDSAMTEINGMLLLKKAERELMKYGEESETKSGSEGTKA